MKTWHHIDPRITAIRVPYGKKNILVISAYAPVQQVRSNTHRANQLYEKLAEITKEAGAEGDVVIIGEI